MPPRRRQKRKFEKPLSSESGEESFHEDQYLGVREQNVLIPDEGNSSFQRRTSVTNSRFLTERNSNIGPSTSYARSSFQHISSNESRRSKDDVCSYRDETSSSKSSEKNYSRTGVENISPSSRENNSKQFSNESIRRIEQKQQQTPQLSPRPRNVDYVTRSSSSGIGSDPSKTNSNINSSKELNLSKGRNSSNKKTLSISEENAGSDMDSNDEGLGRNHGNNTSVVNRDSASQSQIRSPSNTKNKPNRRRKSPGVKALTEIRRYQKSTDLLMQKLPFSRVIREISASHMFGVRWEARAIEALQEAAEAFLVQLFEDSYMCSIHANRVTLKVQDMRLVRRLRTRYE